MSVDLSPLFAPRRVGVLGVSRSPEKLGHRLLANLLEAEFPGEVFPVNPSGEAILGVKSVPRVADLPEGLGTRHRAALGITEESDAVVVVVSEETASISVVVAGQLISGLEAPQLRVTLRDLLTSGRREPGADAAPAPTGSLETPERRASVASAADAGSTG